MCETPQVPLLTELALPRPVQDEEGKGGLVRVQGDPEATPALPEVCGLQGGSLEDRWSSDSPRMRHWVMAPFCERTERAWECPGLELTDLETVKGWLRRILTLGPRQLRSSPQIIHLLSFLVLALPHYRIHPGYFRHINPRFVFLNLDTVRPARAVSLDRLRASQTRSLSPSSPLAVPKPPR